MAKNKKLDAERFIEIRERATRMEQDGSARVALYKDLRDLFLMVWTGAPSADWIKEVVSPDAFDAVISVWRLMMASGDPQISVPLVEHGADESEHDDRLERALRAIYHRAERAKEIKLVQDMVLSAAVDGVASLRIGCSADVIAMAKRTHNTALESAASAVPFTFEALDPGTVYSENDVYGLRRVAIIERRTASEIRDFWGEQADTVARDDTEIEVCDYWDREWRCVWLKSSEEPILMEKHELPFIPIVRRAVQGTTLWKDHDIPEFPLLYPLHKSGMFEMQSLALTMAASTTSAMGSVPFMALKKKSPSQPDPVIDWSRPGINVTLVEGQDIVPLASQSIPDALMQILQLAEGKAQEMTIPKVLMGQSPGSSTSFSALNLLSQSGRLPVVPIQKAVSEALASAFEIVLRWIAHNKKKVTVSASGALAEIDPSLIDEETVWVNVKLEPDLPQDRLSTMNAVNVGTASGLISKKTGREWLHITDSTGEQDQILLEQFIDKHAERFAEEIGQESGLAQPESQGPQPQQSVSPTLDPAAALGIEGSGYDTGAGGLPPVMGGMSPTVTPQMPGGENGNL